MKTEKYNVTGMTCAACQANVTRCVQKLEGVEDVNVSLLANQMTVSYDEAQVHPRRSSQRSRRSAMARPCRSKRRPRRADSAANGRREKTGRKKAGKV